MDIGEIVKFSGLSGLVAGLVIQYDWLVTLLMKREITKEDDKQFPSQVRLSIFVIRLIRCFFVSVMFTFTYHYFVGFKGEFEMQVMGVCGFAFFASFSTTLMLKKFNFPT